MKQIMSILVLLALTITTTNAQRSQGKMKSALSEELDLTDAQKAELKQLHRAQRIETKRIKDDTNATEGEKSEAIMQLREEYKEKRSSILTSEQQAKAEALRAERKELKDEQKDYHKANTRPVMEKEQSRIKSLLSTDELDKLVSIQTLLQSMRPTTDQRRAAPDRSDRRRDQSPMHRAKMGSKAMENLRLNHPDEYAYLQSLSQKYESALNLSLERIHATRMASPAAEKREERTKAQKANLDLNRKNALLLHSVKE